MRRARAIAPLMLAAALAVGVGEAWAQQMATTTTVVARPDFGQIEAMTLEWFRETLTSPQFILGVALGVTLAECGRLLWRWSMRTFGAAQTTVRFILNHRLIAVAVLAAGYYVVAYRVVA
jgi:hypothetical protein